MSDDVNENTKSLQLFLIQWTDRGYLTTIHPSLPPSLRSFKVSWCWSCMSVRTLNSPIFTTYRQGSPCGECMRVCVCVWTRGRGRACTTGSVLVRADHSLRHHRHHHLWTGLHGHTARSVFVGTRRHCTRIIEMGECKEISLWPDRTKTCVD